MAVSLSSDTKDALARDPVPGTHCRRALRNALQLYSGARTHFSTRRNSIARLYRTLDERATLQRHAAGYRLTMSGTAHAEKPTRRCDRIMEARGAFLASGSLSAGTRGYHLEFVLRDASAANRLLRVLRTLGIAAKHAQRRAQELVYLKDFEAIVDFLTIIGAHGAVLQLSNVRALKETKNRIHRLVNTEAANVERAVAAAASQSETIAFLRDAYGFTHLTPALREIATLRLDHPEETLTELGRRCRPPISKPTVSSRVRSLMLLARRLRGETGQTARKT